MKKKPKKDIHTEIDFRDLFDDEGTIRLNPFKLRDKTYRVCGTAIIKKLYCHNVLCEETRKYTWIPTHKLEEKVMRAKAKTPKPLVKLEELPENPTIEEHKKKFPNQSNMFEIIPDVKIK